MDFFTMDVLISLGGIFGALYLFVDWNNDFFEKQKINFVKPMLLLGNIGPTILRQKPFAAVIQNIYNAFPDSKYIGMFEYRRPIFMIRDPEIIKQITLKDYDHFIDHGQTIDENLDPIFGKNLLFVKGHRWREMRFTLSTAFTRSKMSAIYGLVNDCAEQMMQNIKMQTKNGASILELKDIFSRIANDVIASTAFGLKIDSFKEKNNQFYEMVKIISSPTAIQNVKFYGYTSFPSIMKKLKIQFFDSITTTFFRDLIKNTIQLREKQKIVRHDIIQFLMDAHQETLTNEDKDCIDNSFASVDEHPCAEDANIERKELTVDDITAQAIMFLFAGFETVSTLLCFAVYEVALDQNIQHKLQTEIDEILNEKMVVTYEVVQSVKYLDMIISETLRMWPPIPVMDRCCVKPFNMTDGKKTVKLMPGQAIWVPVYALHRDPKYFPNPEKFDPERFSENNKNDIKSCTYLPFGSGPRNCIGSRFAIMEAKVIIFHLFAKFNLNICAKTKIPMELSTKTFKMCAEDEFWIEFKPRI